MCIVTTPDGIEVIVSERPEVVTLNNHNIRETMRLIEQEQREYSEYWRKKRQRRTERNKPFWKRLFA